MMLLMLLPCDARGADVITNAGERSGVETTVIETVDCAHLNGPVSTSAASAFSADIFGRTNRVVTTSNNHQCHSQVSA